MFHFYLRRTAETASDASHYCRVATRHEHLAGSRDLARGQSEEWRVVKREREKATVYSRQCQSESSSSTLHARWNEQERCRAVSDRESVSTSHRPRYLWPWPVTLTLIRRRAMVTTRTQAKDHCRRSVLLCSVLNISRRRLDVRNIQGGSKK